MPSGTGINNGLSSDWGFGLNVDTEVFNSLMLVMMAALVVSWC